MSQPLQFEPIIRPQINHQIPKDAKTCQEIPKNAKESKSFDSTKRSGTGSGFVKAPVH